MKWILITALAVLLVLEAVTENLPILKSLRPIRLTVGLLLALAGIGYALWVRADVFAWDFPTRLALSGCLFPALTLLEDKLPRYKAGLTWAAAVLYVILLLLTAFK